jgi:hypothetical protein
MYKTRRPRSGDASHTLRHTCLSCPRPRVYPPAGDRAHTMSGLKNSPFGKRLRARQDRTSDEDEGEGPPGRRRIFGLAAASTSSLALDRSRPSSPERSSRERGQSPAYGDRFVPARTGAGDMRAAYNLLDDAVGTPRRSVIPSESDALKGLWMQADARVHALTIRRAGEHAVHVDPAHRGRAVVVRARIARARLVVRHALDAGPRPAPVHVRLARGAARARAPARLARGRRVQRLADPRGVRAHPGQPAAAPAAGVQDAVPRPGRARARGRLLPEPRRLEHDERARRRPRDERVPVDRAHGRRVQAVRPRAVRGHDQRRRVDSAGQSVRAGPQRA